MIVDRLSNSHLYSRLSPRIEQAFEYLRQTDLERLPAGHYEIDGKNLYVLVQEYSTKPKEEGKWEAHRQYIDLHHMVRGAEQIGFAQLSRLTPGEYDPAKDFLPLSGVGDSLTLAEGEFVLLFPQDAHMPGLSVDAPDTVKKVVVKMAIE